MIVLMHDGLMCVKTRGAVCVCVSCKQSRARARVLECQVEYCLVNIIINVKINMLGHESGGPALHAHYDGTWESTLRDTNVRCTGRCIEYR